MTYPTVNRLKAFAGFAGLLVSMLFTWKFLKESIGWTTPDEKFVSTTLAIVLNVIEIVCFSFWYLRRDWSIARWACFALGSLIALISISGSLGFFQIKIDRNTIESDLYQLQKKQVEKWQEASDEKKHPKSHLWAAKKAEEAQRELAAISTAGAGTGNALYKLYARIFKTDQFSVSLIFTLLLALSLEIFAVFSFVTSLEQSPYPTTTQPRQRRKIEPEPKPKNPPAEEAEPKETPENTTAKTALQKANQQRQMTKSQRKQYVFDLHKNEPDLSISEIANRAKISPQTVKGYFKELGIDDEKAELLSSYR